MNYWLIFLTGLTTGGVSCALMQGGILAGIIAGQKKSQAKVGFGFDDWGPVTAFLTTKLLAHIILGAFLGWIGSKAELNLSVKLFFQGLAALFMFGAAMNLLEIHPLFRYMVIQPPRFAYRLIKQSSHLSTLFAPALFGALTVLIPCGVTQAMSVVAISSGTPLAGAMTMGSFVLGTVPAFAAIGLATARMTELWQHNFSRVAASLLIIMSLYSVNGIATALDSPYSLDRIIAVINTPVGSVAPAMLVNGVQKVTLSVENSGYSPRYFSVQRDVPVELTLSAGKVYTCALAFNLPKFGISTNLDPQSSQTFTFTPKEKGRYTYTCSMGMYSGTMEVI